MPKLTGKELAGELGCARSTLSEATSNGHLVSGRWDVGEWAVCGPSGRVKHYRVPDDVAFLNGEQRSNPEEESSEIPSLMESTRLPSTDASTDSPILGEIIREQQQTVRQVAEKSGNRTHLFPEGTDVSGTSRNAGLAYAAGKAIENPGPGAHAFWTAGSALAGGVGGYAITEDGFGALVGALLFGSAGYLVYEQSQRSHPRRESRSGRSDWNWQQPR